MHRPSRLRLTAIACAAVLPPTAVLFDLARPVMFEHSLLEQLATARGVHEPIVDRLDYVISAVLVSSVAVAVMLALARSTQILARMTLAMWSTALVLLCFEAGMCLISRPYVHPPGLKRVRYPSPSIMPGITGPSKFTTNQLGIRGPNWKDADYKILCIGGSTTICGYLDDEETWPRQLMQFLNDEQPDRRYWVGNVGKSGHDSYHHIELISRLPEASLVDCCLVLCGVNDLEHSIRLPYIVRERVAPASVFAEGGAYRQTEPYLKQTYLYRRIKALLRYTSLKNTMEVEDVDGKAYRLRRQVRQAARKDYPLPPLDEHLDRYKNNLHKILTLCRARGVRCIVMTQPTLWDDEMSPEHEALLWSKPIGRTGRALRASDLAEGMEGYNRALQEFCDAESVECIDLVIHCPKDTTVFYDDEHFNESGARIVARTIADYFLEADMKEGKPGASRS